MSEPRTPPGYCAHCKVECQDVDGRTIWGPTASADLAGRIWWRCPLCQARVGSHPNGKPLGTAADAQLRGARIYVHGRLDPIWKNAHRHPAYADGAGQRTMKSAAIIAKTARKRVYRFLAARLGLAFDDTHVAMFDLQECRAAYRALAGVTYDDVRAWAKENPELPKVKRLRGKVSKLAEVNGLPSPDADDGDRPRSDVLR